MRSLEDVQSGFRRLRDLDGEVSPRSWVLLVARFLLDIADRPGLMDAFAEELLADLPVLDGPQAFEGIPAEDLLTLADALDGASLGLDNDPVGELRIERLSLVTEALAKAAEGPPNPVGGSSITVVLIEDVATLPFRQLLHTARLRGVGFHLRRDKNTDEVVLSGVAHGEDGSIQARLRRPVLLARRLLDVGNRERYSGVIETGREAVLQGLNSARLGLTLACLEAISVDRVETHFWRFSGRLGAIGDVDVGGRIPQMDPEDLKPRVRALFYSSVQTILVPYESRDGAEAVVRAEMETWPERKLEVLGLHKVRDALHDDRILQRIPRPFATRLGKWLHRWRVWLVSFGAVAALAVALLGFGLAPLPVLKWIAPGASWGGGGAVPGLPAMAYTATLSRNDELLLGGWSETTGTVRSAFMERRQGGALVPAGRWDLGPGMVTGLISAGDGTIYAAVVQVSGANIKSHIVSLDGKSRFEVASFSGEVRALCMQDDDVVAIGESRNERGTHLTAWTVEGAPIYVHDRESGANACYVDGDRILIGGWEDGPESRQALVVALGVEGSLDPTFADSGAFRSDWSLAGADEVESLDADNGGLLIQGTSRWGGDVQVVLTRPSQSASESNLTWPVVELVGKSRQIRTALYVSPAGETYVLASTLNPQMPYQKDPPEFHRGVLLRFDQAGRTTARLVLSDGTNDEVLLGMTSFGDRLVVAGYRASAEPPRGIGPLIYVVESQSDGLSHHRITQ